MKSLIRLRLALRGKAALFLCLGLAAGPLQATPIITAVNADLSSAPFTFSFLGSSFTFTGTGGFPDFLSVSTTGNAAVRTVFGHPSTDFVDRGLALYDQNTLGGFGSFSALTPVPYTNGDNFLGLRVTVGGDNYYGFLFSTNATLNSYGFETEANAGIIGTTQAPAAVPEPLSWAMMVGGFGLIGASMRRRGLAVRYG